MRPWSRAFALLVLSVAAYPAAAQDYPNKTIRVIASQAPGGLSDVFMRTLVEELNPLLGQSIVIENRTGGNGTIGARACADAPPDGYTFCIIPGEAMLINPIINKSSFDPKTQLIPVTRLFYLTQVFAVNASLGVKTFAELAALARAKPKTLNYMAPNLDKVAFMEDFNRTNGIDLIRVPFKGGGDAVNNMLNGATPMAIIGIGNVQQYVADGKIVGLAVDGDQRSPLVPAIPTMKELGFADFVQPSFFGIYVPAGTPQAIVDRLHREIVKSASREDFQKRHIINRGMTAVLDKPDEFAAALDADRIKAMRIVKGSGLYPDIN